MKYIIDFYKGLDTINLMLFWGIIIVIFLLLIFSIIIVNKNKKLKKIIVTKEQEVEESKNELAIKNEQINIIENTKIEEKVVENINSNKTIKDNDVKEEKYQVRNNINITIPPKEENFVAEEHVINYHQNNNVISEIDTTPELPTIEEPDEENIQINIEQPKETKKEIIMPTGPYQRNILREMSLNQTSPIGIVKQEQNYNKEVQKAQELHDNLKNIEIKKEHYENNYQKEMNNSKEMINKIYEKKETDTNIEKNNIDNEKGKTPKLEIVSPPKQNKENDYLNEVSKKLSEAKENDELERTEYEIKQEEDAIISYEELMQKKDQIKMIDEEDAVISIEELYNKNKEKEKLYNITKEEEDDKFISELKHFRSDL